MPVRNVAKLENVLSLRATKERSNLLNSKDLNIRLLRQKTPFVKLRVITSQWQKIPKSKIFGKNLYLKRL